MRKIALLAISVLIAFSPLCAQNRTVTGKVLDEKGNPVPGASIVIKGTGKGTATNPDGTFTISVPESAKTIIVSALNFAGQNVAVADNVSVTLKASAGSLNEVVIVAYGAQKKSEISSAVSTVNADVIKNQQIVTVGQALQGTAPGVLVVNTNGQPGSNPEIRIRGVASIAASAAPFIVLDGIPFDGNLNMINPGDIESFSILKDAAAGALYGSRAGNGVILINTKSGKKNSTPSVNLSAIYGVSSRAIKDYEYLNTQQQYELGWEGLKNVYEGNPDPAQLATDDLIDVAFHYNPYGPNYAKPVGTDGKLVAGATPLWNDDWTKALQRENANRKDVNLGVSGGGEKSKYFFSVGYLNQDGYVIKSNYERISARLNYTTDIKSWLQLGARVAIASSKQNYPDQGSTNYSDVIQYGRTMSSVFPIYAHDDNGEIIKDSKGNPIYDFGRPDPNRDVNVNRPVLQPSNVVATVNLDNWNYKRVSTDLNTYALINFTKDLYFKSSFGINRNLRNQFHYEDKDFGDASSVGGRVYQEQNLITSWTWNNMLNYSKKFGDHHIEAMVSYESYKYNYETIYGSKTGFAFSGQQQLTNASTNEDFQGYTTSSTLLSYLGRLKYDYKGKYFAEITARRDGASVFAPGYQYGSFPAAGVSWVVSQEGFLSNVKFINFLKLRASYGALGNNALLDGAGAAIYFPYLNTYSSGYNDLTNSGVYLSQLANAQIQWEKQLNANIGLDFELLKGSLSGSIDFFEKNSKNLALNKPLAPSAGFGSVLYNIGKVQNKGVELNLNYQILHGKSLTWDVMLNITYLKNKIVELLPGVDTFAASGPFRNVVGKSVYEFYLPVWAGVDAQTGGGLWLIDEKDANGNPTGKQITTDDYSEAQANQKWVGSGLPKYTGGFGTKLGYKNFDLSVLFNYALGGKYYDGNYAGLMHGLYNGFGAQLSTDELNRWQKPGDITDVPKLNPNNNDEEQRSTRFLVSGDYLRLRNITLGYSYNAEKSLKFVKSVRLYVQADNLLTCDKLKRGSDPESSIDGDAGINAVVFKTFSVGLDFNF